MSFVNSNDLTFEHFLLQSPKYITIVAAFNCVFVKLTAIHVFTKVKKIATVFLINDHKYMSDQLKYIAVLKTVTILQSEITLVNV